MDGLRFDHARPDAGAAAAHGLPPSEQVRAPEPATAAGIRIHRPTGHRHGVGAPSTLARSLGIER